VQIDSYNTPAAEALLHAGEERLTGSRHQQRELVANSLGAAAFLTGATLLAVLAPWGQQLSWINLLLVLAVWVTVEHVSFPVGAGLTYPTVLVFVPALFLLPTPLVPLVAAAAKILRRTPNIVRGRAPRGLIPVLVTDAWFSAGPALVIVATGTQRFAWSHWPAYLLALVAQLAVDLAASITFAWAGEGIRPRVQLPLFAWLYIVDFALAPVGLLIAAAAVEHPALILLALSPLALLWLFARERRERLDETLALSTAYRGTALLLGDVVEADDYYTGAHSREVVDLSVAVADSLGLNSAQKRNVEFAALLHDVGKLRVPKEIINKPGPLDDEEWNLIRNHTVDGERMLTQVGGLLAEVGAIVRASHEWWDGGGYPDGLAREQIPIEARIVCSCDAFCAMTSDRPYRRALSIEQALAELRRCAGTQFDRTVVAEVIRVVNATAHAADERRGKPRQAMEPPRLAATG
jgi:putative nucleotidyltransferase with HDIG domain